MLNKQIQITKQQQKPLDVGFAFLSLATVLSMILHSQGMASPVLTAQTMLYGFAAKPNLKSLKT